MEIRPSSNTQLTTVAVAQETKTPSWRRSKTIMRRMMEVSAISNVGAVLCALVYGVLNPFRAFYAGDVQVRTRAVAGTAALTAFYIVVWGVLTASVLYAFFLRGRYLRQPSTSRPDTGQLTLAQSWKITVRLTWKRALVTALLSGGVTGGLSSLGVPVVSYNIHTLVGVVCVATHSMQAISRVVRFRLKHTSSVSIAQEASQEAAQDGHVNRRARPRRSVGKVLLVAITNVVPQLFAAAAGMQFMAAGKSLNVRDQRAVGLYIFCGLLFKFSFQMLAKMLAMKASAASSNSRNRLYVITSPILIIEIYLRMAALRLGGGGNSKSLYTGAVFVGFLEILVRVLAVLVDRFLVNRERKKVDGRKRDVMRQKTPRSSNPLASAHSCRSIQIAPTTAAVSPKSRHERVAQLDAEFEARKANHLRLSAMEVMAEMVAEYCGIGFACVYVVLLRDNPAFDLGTGSQTTIQSLDEWTAFLGSHLTNYAVQVLVEMFSDIVGGSIEMYMGIHVDEVFAKDELVYIRWTVLVLAIHAGGLSISGLVAA